MTQTMSFAPLAISPSDTPPAPDHVKVEIDEAESFPHYHGPPRSSEADFPVFGIIVPSVRIHHQGTAAHAQ